MRLVNKISAGYSSLRGFPVTIVTNMYGSVGPLLVDDHIFSKRLQPRRHATHGAPGYRARGWAFSYAARRLLVLTCV